MPENNEFSEQIEFLNYENINEDLKLEEKPEKKIIKDLSKNFILKDFLAYSESGKAIKIDKKNFYFFDLKPEFEKIKNKKIAFVDGGICEILKSSLMGVYFNRIYYTIYQNNKRIKNYLVEFYSYIFPKIEEDKILLICEIFYFGEKKILYLKNNYNFDGFDKKISVNNKIVDIEIVANIVRRFAELNIINEIEADYVVLDGSFDINYPDEEKILKYIIEETKKKEKIILGLSKTNQFIIRGFPLSYFLNKVANESEKKEFIYYLDESDYSKVFFIKNIEQSDFCFRLDLLNGFLNLNEIKNLNYLLNKKLKEIFFLLKENSKDPIFLGYPYGLIEADMFARISNKEKEQLMIRFLSLFGKEGKEIKKIFFMNKTHDVLDKIRF
ncbi:MAG: hypothetical protein QXR96_01025 [Candidatus Woesearchaeota archaeon]